MAKEAQELRAQSDEELRVLKDEKRAGMFKIRGAFTDKDKDAKRTELRASRKTVARVLTILRERELRT